MFLVNLAWAQERPAPPPDGQLAVPGRPGWSVDAGSGCWVWNANPKLLQIVVWAGGWGADGPASGQGVREWHTDGKMTSRYEGEMQEGKPNGQGVITAADGSRYEGEFRNGKFNGRGVMTTANGSRYEGEFRDGKLNGNGFLTAPNGYRYEGEFRNGKANGQGVVIFPTGRR